MPEVTFAGRDRLTEILDASVGLGSTEEVTESVKDGLCGLIRERRLDVPAAARRPGEDSYGRHLLYRSDEHGYVVVAMAWGPGQGTPVHDHAGVWCVEAVLSGTMEVQQYDLCEQDGEWCRFRPQGSVTAGPGAGGALIPPYEYHTLANAAADTTSVTIHVYGRDLERCAVFEPTDREGWYRKRIRQLSYS